MVSLRRIGVVNIRELSTLEGNADNNIQAWDGTTWHSMGGGTGTVPGWANGNIYDITT